MNYIITDEQIQNVLNSIETNITFRQAKEISAYLKSNQVEPPVEATNPKSETRHQKPELEQNSKTNKKEQKDA